MDKGMTGATECNPVVNVVAQFGIIPITMYVMGICTDVPTDDAKAVVTGFYRNAP